MSRLVRIVLLVGVLLGMGVPSAGAHSDSMLNRELSALWTTVLETPSAQNAFGSGGSAYACWNIGRHTVAPFGPAPGVDSCTVRPGTRLFVVGASYECSSFEGNGSTEAELRKCARKSDDPVAPKVTVDGRPVRLAEVETPLLHLVLPPDNIFDQPPNTRGVSVGHGWAVLLHPLRHGTHVIVIDTGTLHITTTIVVKPC